MGPEPPDAGPRRPIPFGRYQLIARLAVGGMGEMNEAASRQLVSA